MIDQDPPEDPALEDERGDDPTPEAGEVEPKPTPGKRFRTARPDELAPQSFMVADERAAGRLRMFGGSIQGIRGGAEFCGDAIRRLARLLKETAVLYAGPNQFVGEAMLRGATLGQSIVIELEIGVGESVGVDVEGRPSSPTIEAARTLGSLLAAPTAELVRLAEALPSDATNEYKQFLKLLGSDNVTVEWMSAGASEYVVTTSLDARHDHAILDSEGEEVVETFPVPGVLTMADARGLKFELELGTSRPDSAFFRRRTTVKGKYAEEVGEAIEAQGLWNHDVLATVEVTYDAPNTTVTPRKPAFRLIDAVPGQAPPPREDAPTLLDEGWRNAPDHGTSQTD